MGAERRERIVIIIIMMMGVIIILVVNTGGVQIINGRIMDIRIGMKMTTMADGSLNSSNNSHITHPGHNLEDLLMPISDQTGQERPGHPPMKTTTDLDQTGMEIPVLSMDEDLGRERLGHLPLVMHIHSNIHIPALLHLDHHQATHPLNNNNNPIALAHNLKDHLPTTTVNLLSLQAVRCIAPTSVLSHEAPQQPTTRTVTAPTRPDHRQGSPSSNNPKLPTTPPCNVPARNSDVSADPPTSPTALNQATINRRTCCRSNARCVIGNDTRWGI